MSNKIGYINPRFIIITTGILILFWAFGSYFISVEFDGVKQCIPPIDGCEYISHSANYHISSIFYRATVLPATVLLAFSNYFILQYVKNYANISKFTYLILFLIAVIIAPIALNITEALPNGTLHYGFKHLHNIFAGISFGTIVIFELTVSIILIFKSKNIFFILLLILSLIDIILLIIPVFMPIHTVKVICQWNLLISNSLWFIVFGIGINMIYCTKEIKVS